MLRTIDLFAGIGGIRLGFEQATRSRNVFSAEIDKQACRTYEANFGESPFCDVTKIDEKSLPDFDVLLAGFPCQAFSRAGKQGGFADTRGTLFFDVARIIKEKRPKAFLLENVKNLKSHDGGRTFEVILNTLRKDLGYTVYAEVLNAKDYGVPQKRERIYIVGFKDETAFAFPQKQPLIKGVDTVIEKRPVSAKYYLSDTYLAFLREHRARHEAKGNGFGYVVLDPAKPANTIVTGGMGRERNLIIDRRLRDFTPVTNIKGNVNREGVRRLTPRETARLQGFPDDFLLPCSDSATYKQTGNSVCVPVIRQMAERMVEAMGKLDA